MTDATLSRRDDGVGRRSGRAADSFRPEIHALRAVAVTLVVLFHLWPNRLPGGFIGVDVFFVISGMLITAHLFREVVATGTIDLPRFWARRVRRLLPAALTVLAVTLVTTVVFLPAPMWQQTAVQVAASAGYVVNWVLAAEAVDYFAEDAPATAVQHFWSLSVEEQFYLLWPVLALALVAIARRRGVGAGGGLRRTVAGGIAVLAGASFAYSAWYSGVSDAAYFSTLTHAWEFAAGGLLALALPWVERRLRPHLLVRRSATLVGVVVLVASGFLFTGALAFPGWIAVVPVVAVLVVIACGGSWAGAIPRVSAVAWPAVRWVGDVSYSAYLWHWPLIVVAPFVLDREPALLDKLAILALTLALAQFTKRAIEDPVRFAPGVLRRPRATFALAAAGMAVVIGLASALWLHSVRSEETAESNAVAAGRDAGPCYGAGAVLSGEHCADPHRVDPELLLAAGEPVPDPTPVTLSTGLSADEYVASEEGPTVALVGDSHARMYLTAMYEIAERNGWRLLEIRHNDCTPSAPTWESTFPTDMKPSCQEFRRNLIDELAVAPEVDMVVTSSVAPRYDRMPGADHDGIRAAFEETYRSWLDGGKRVVVIADVPGPSEAVGDTPSCVAASEDLDDPCASSRAEVLELDLQVSAARALATDGVALIDFTDRYCDAEVCHAVFGGVVMYRDGAHISGVFSQSLGPFLEPPLIEALGR